MVTKKDILDAYAFLRTKNQSIPDEVLDFIKDASLEKLKANSGGGVSYASPASSGVQTAGRFRKKPVVIEAMQYNAYSTKIMDEIEIFVGGDIGKDVDGNTVIATLEGAMKVSHLDWVIKGVKGEFYPCKPDIFEATYEKL